MFITTRKSEPGTLTTCAGNRDSLTAAAAISSEST